MRLAKIFAIAASVIASTYPASGQEPTSEDTGMTEAQKVAFIKDWVGSKFAIKEFCKSANPERTAEFEAAWANYLAIESPEGKAYAASPEIIKDSTVRLNEFAEEAKRSPSAREGLTMSCDGALKGKKF